MNQKNDNELNLALSVPDAQRAKTENLNTGFDQLMNTWELIIRYNGDIINAANRFGAEIKILSGGYAIVKISENQIDAFAAEPEVIFLEKPKKLFYEVEYSEIMSCIPQVRYAPYNLTGKGIIVAIIDSGIDYNHPDFINEDGTTRILSIYDENTDTEYDRQTINEAIRTGDSSIVPVRDISGHGTHVAGIAAGNGRASKGQYIGVASEAEIIAVKLGDDDFFSTARLMEAIDYVLKKSEEYGLPVAINLSFGNNYGSHDGTSLIETYIDTVCGEWKNVIVAGTGNEAAKGIHKYGFLSRNSDIIELSIGSFEASIDIQLWKNYIDDFYITIETPDGRRFGPVFNQSAITRFATSNSIIYVYYGEPSPYSRFQEIFFQIIPTNEYIDYGIWKIILDPAKIIDGRYDFWLPAGTYISENTRFYNTDPEVTLTIPSTSFKVISVGAYDARAGSYADFSGRGYTRTIKVIKPDIVAPGVAITAPAVGGGYISRTGTSMATPFVTGSAALLMEWGITRNNDPYLYGEKIKAYLIKGAKQLTGMSTPNPMTGWGALCVRDSLPI